MTVLRRLEAARIHYRLEQTRVVPGERWEIEFLETVEVEIELFRSNGEILDAQALDDLYARFSDVIPRLAQATQRGPRRERPPVNL